MSIKQIIMILQLFGMTALYAELLIFKKTSEGLVALTKEESLLYGPTISQIILKYQWPMCTASNLTQVEKDELLTPGIPNAEEIFIQKKLQEAIPDLNIHVAFIPTTLYELFCMYEFVKTDKTTITSKFIDFSKNSFERACMTAYLEGCSEDLRRASSDENFRILILSELFFNFEDSKNEILNQFKIYNQLFFDTTVKYLIGPFMGNKTPIQLFIPEDLSAYMYMNNYIITKLIEIELFILKEKCLKVSSTIQENSEMILKKILEMFGTASYNKALFGQATGSMFFENKNYLMFLNHENLIKSVIEKEYRAKSLNKAMLLRGTDLLNVNNLKKIYRGVETSKGAEEIPVLGTTMTHQDLKDNLFSISLGQSLFAGIFIDQTACAFYFLQNKPGYALLIDKKEYIRSASNGLFFIPPLSTIAALFGFGEFFHPRTKVPLSSLSDSFLRIKGFAPRVKVEYHPLLFIVRNPLVHAELFSEFVAQNGIILNLDEVRAKNVLENQKELSNAYSNTRTIKKYFNKLKH
ncbi:hypothetical protein KBB68_01710 [Candidatus Babeliales bacterium]|nr:hypothetical protein [Candidatus Babeliales bacterium]